MKTFIVNAKGGKGNENTAVIVVEGVATKQPAVYKRDADAIYEALRNTLPCGTMDSLLRNILADYPAWDEELRTAASIVIDYIDSRRTTQIDVKV